MKRAVFLLGMLASLAARASLVLKPGIVEVVVAPSAPSITRFAAEEMTNFLSRVLGAPVPVVGHPSGKRCSLVLGTNAWSRAIGVDTTGLKRDGFVIHPDERANRVYISGNDDPAYDLTRRIRRGEHPDDWGKEESEKGTLYGVYEFLERYADCRFFFPGEIGTVVPGMDKVVVGREEIRSEPTWSTRIVFTYEFGDWFEKLSRPDLYRVEQLEQLRLRSSSANAIGCHGQFNMNMAKRFAAAHPEYFVLKADGTRMTNAARATLTTCQHLCQSSKVWDEIYADAKSYFNGEPPECRGVLKGFGDKAQVVWGPYASLRKYYDVNPQDGMPLCCCAACKAAYAKTKNPKFPATELVWGRAVELANRLKAEGIPGKIVLQGGYGRFGGMPDFPLPENMIVTIGGFGPWIVRDRTGVEAEYANVRAWSRKAYGNCWMWTYVGKFRTFGLSLPTVPMGTPRAIGAYCQALSADVNGIFLELGSERFIQHYLDLYVYSKVAWDGSCDVKAVLDDHYVKMFGRGAADMRAFFEALEDKWLTIVGKASPVPWGYGVRHLDAVTVMREIYSAREVSRLEDCISRAIARVGTGSPEARRMRFMREQLLVPVADWAEKGRAATDVRLEEKTRKGLPASKNVIAWDCDSAGGWSVQKGTVAVDVGTKLSGKASIRYVSTDDRPMDSVPYAYTRATLVRDGIPLKPATRYRFSCYLKTKDLQAVCGYGGLELSIQGDCQAVFTAYRGNGAEKNGNGGEVTGTHDWQAFVREFETPAQLRPGAMARLVLRYVFASGTAWVDDVRIDEF